MAKYAPSTLTGIKKAMPATVNQSGWGINNINVRLISISIIPKTIELNIFDDDDFQDVTYPPIAVATSPRINDNWYKYGLPWPMPKNPSSSGPMKRLKTRSVITPKKIAFEWSVISLLYFKQRKKYQCDSKKQRSKTPCEAFGLHARVKRLIIVFPVLFVPIIEVLIGKCYQGAPDDTDCTYEEET
jgi:hypothetical protein